MALYRVKDSEYWWVSIINPRTRQRIRKSTKLKDKAMAKLFEEQLMANLVLGEEHYALKPKQSLVTWKDAAERWLQETSHKRDTKNDRIKLAWLAPHLETRELNSISPTIIHRVAELKAGETSETTANRTLALVRAILNRAYKQWGWLEKPVFIRLYKEDTRRIRYLTKEEAKRLLAELPPHLKDMAIFALQTGLRASNITNLQWSQVDLERQHVWIHPDQAKAGKAIAVPLNTAAINVLNNQQGKNPTYVFTFRNKPVTRPSNHAWLKALKRAGIQNFRWHDLRHTWASWHIQAGTPIHILQELGGWSNYEMVKRYAHLTSEHLITYQCQISLDDS